MDLSSLGLFRRPSFLHVMFAPWIYLFVPARAAVVMVSASAAAFWSMYAVHAAFAAASVVFWALWLQTARWNWMVAPTSSGGTTTVPTAGTWQPLVEHRSIGEVWIEWHGGSLFGPAELTFFGVLAGIASFGLLLAGLNLPRVHRDGPIWVSFWRSHRIVAAGAGAVLFRLCSIAALFAAVHRASRIDLFFRQGEAFLWIIPTVVAAPVFLLHWLGLAVRGAPRRELGSVLPPRCEGCGYDLSVAPGGQRCPECGLAIVDSITPGARRRPHEWLLTPTLLAWWRASWEILTRPGKYYAALPVRAEGEAAAEVFSRWHLLLMGVGGACWLGSTYIADVYYWDWKELIAIATGAGFGTILVAWFASRAVGAVAAGAVIVLRAVPDVAWIGRVVAYETVFAWVACCCSGVFISTVLIWGEWLSEAVGARGFVRAFGTTPEVLLLVFGNAALVVVWLLRYRKIVAAIRWSNF